MSTRPSTSTGGTGGVPSNVHLNITAAPKQYIWYGGERYLVQAFQKGTGAGGTDLDITDARDWTEAGLAAMKAADKVFQRNSVNIAEVKTVQVPLTGEVSIEEGKTTQATNIKIGSNIQYAKTVTNKPTTPITLKPEDLQSIQDEITEIGQATATWKDPTLSHQRSQQQGAATSQRTDTPPPQATPTDSTASNPSTTPEIQLPQLTFAPPTPYQHDQGAALSSFLKSQQTGSATSPINTHQENKPASETISAQLAQFNPAETHTPEALHKGAASYIADHLSNFANNATDSEEMFTALKTQYDASTGNLAALKTKLKDGAARSTKLGDSEYSTLESCLANKTASQLSPEEKLLVVKAFANSIHKTQHTDQQSYPKVYFKAMHAFYDTKKVDTTLGIFGGREEGSGKSLVIVERTATGDYKIWGRWPESGVLRPDRTAFILYNSTAAGGKYSGFSRTTGMDARDPLQLSAPQTGITTRPAYYTDCQDIETGGSGNCGAFALADAILQKDETYYRTDSDWKAALAQQKVGIRQNAMQHLFNHADQFTTDDLFPVVLESINTSLSEIFSQQPSNALTLRKLLDKPPGALTPEQKKWMVQLYAVYATNEGKDLDKPFFLAFAMSTRQKVAIIQNNRIVFTAPLLDQAISKDDYLFVHHDGGNHFRSINRSYTATHTSPSLDAIISQYNNENTYLFARKAFVKSLAYPGTIPEKLSKLKTDDPHGYLTMQEIAGSDVVKAAAEGTDIDSFLEAVSSKDIEQEIRLHSNLQARANFLSKLIEAKTNRPASEDLHSPIQAELRTALGQMKDTDTAGYMYFRTLITRGDNYATIPDHLNMTPLLDMDLHITTTLDGTDSGTIPDPDARQKEIASRKASMLAEAGATITEHFIDEDNSAEKARAEFLQTLMKMPTDREPDVTNTSLLKSTLDGLAKNDPAGYFAFSAFVTGNRDVTTGGWAPYIAKRDALLGHIMRYHDDKRITAQANVITAVQAKNPEEILAAVQHLQQNFAQDYLALENVMHKGALTPEEMSEELQTIMNNPTDAAKLPEFFAFQIRNPRTAALYSFLTEFNRYKEALGRDSYSSSHNYNAAYRRDLIEAYPTAHLAIEDLFYSRGEDHRGELNASMHAVKNIDAAVIQKHIVDSEKTMIARDQFLAMLHSQKETPSLQNMSKLQIAITKMQTDDVHGFLGLVHITKKTNPAEIAAELVKASFETTYKQFVPNPGTEDLRNTIYDPIPFSQAKLIQAAKMDPPAITEELLNANLHASLVLGLLVYKPPVSDAPSTTPSPHEKAQQGLALIREAIRGNQLTPLLKDVAPDAYVRELITTHLQDDTLTEGRAD
ncbi:MAG: hypothetical protein KF898_08415 [Parachlamydiales bacterium]|nr:hypothetical protein [Candidatus Acheromyda pituitae]